MTKAEWDALKPEQRCKIVAERLMGWHQQEGHASFWWLDGNNYTTLPVKGFKPTTDRNDCALVLDKIAEHNLSVEFIDAMTDESDPPLLGAGERANLFYGIIVGPDTICYCAVKAVECGDGQ